jgi:hypothetical protein
VSLFEGRSSGSAIPIRGDCCDGHLPHAHFDLVGCRFPVQSPRDIDNLAPIYRRHQQRPFLFQGLLHESLDFCSGDFAIFEQSN